MSSERVPGLDEWGIPGLTDEEHAAAMRAINEGFSQRVEWRVTGEPGHGYPSYSYTFADEEKARGFVALMRDSMSPWAAGPFLHRREVLTSEWSEVSL